MSLLLFYYYFELRHLLLNFENDKIPTDSEYINHTILIFFSLSIRLFQLFIIFFGFPK